MKKMFVGVLLASAALMACGSKKASTTPQDKPQEMTGGATGGATYGGATAQPPTANPCATK